MARIELSNIGGGTTLSLTTTGTSGASTLAGSVLNIPVYQGQLTLTTTGTSGAATLSANVLNIPQYSGGGGGTPAGSTGEIQYNNAGAFGASSNLAWDNSNVRLNIGAPLSPNGRINVKGGGTLTTVNTRLTNSGDTELLKVLDNGSTNIGTGFNWDNVNSRLGLGTSTPTDQLVIRASEPVLNWQATGYSHSYSNQQWSRANQVLSVLYWSPTNGGAFFSGIGNSAFVPSLSFFGASNSATGNVYAPVAFIAGKRSGTDMVAMGATEKCFSFNQGAANFSQGTELITVLGSGNTGFSVTNPSARLQVRGANTTATVGTFIVEDGAATPVTIYRIDNDGKVTYRATNTSAGNTGAQTINRPSGTVNFAGGATSLVVTNSLCTTASIILPVIRTNDATAQIKNVVAGSGFFTINLSAAATAETSVGFFIIN